MKQLVYLSALCMIVLSSCSEAFKKGDKGLEYKIIHDGGSQQLKVGDFMQLNIKEIYAGTKDSVLSDTKDQIPTIIAFDSVSTPPAYFKILSQLKKGDSAVIRVLTDSIFKERPEQMPPFMKKGKYILTTIRLTNIFKTREQADSAQKAEIELAKPRMLKKQQEQIEKSIAENKAQIESDDKVIEAYLAAHNIKATKTKWGTYVAIQTEGTGNNITMNDVASVYYSGKTLGTDSVFDSNNDPKLKKPAYSVPLSQYQVILGWIDALQQMKKGTKATIYIPSSLGYGKTGNGKILPNANLVFDMEIADVENEDVAMKRMQAMQDSIQKANPQQAPPPSGK